MFKYLTDMANDPRRPYHGIFIFMLFIYLLLIVYQLLMTFLQLINIFNKYIFLGTALICLQNLIKTFKYGGRQFLLSGSEIEAITVIDMIYFKIINK